jgi:oligopeptide transport system permease protein
MKTQAINTTAAPVLTPEMFRPEPAGSGAGEIISRPILTYFQDASLRFLRNKIGVACLAFLAFVGLVGLIGPLFFPDVANDASYENVINTDFQNQKPSVGEKLLVTDDGFTTPDLLIKEGFNSAATLLTQEGLKAPGNFEVAGDATVNGVELRWNPIEGVSGYEIYRIVGREGDLDLSRFASEPTSEGMTLGKIEDPAQHSFIDSTGLDPSEHYAYAIVSYVTSPDTGETITSQKAAVAETSLVKIIKLTDAQALDSKAEVGKKIRGRPYLFGTDSLGRDIFARMVSGTRINFALALIVPTICLILGLIYGAVSGLSGGKVDLVMMRILEVLDTLPYLLLMIILQLVMGKGLFSLIIAMCAFGWTGFARMIRGEVLRLREIEFVHASRLLGAPLPRLIFRHIAPNLIGLILVVWSSRLPGVIVSEAFLSLLGLGLEAPTASWGMVLNEAAQQFQSHPVQFLLPASVMAVTLLAFFLLGDALTEALDPKLRGRD